MNKFLIIEIPTRLLAIPTALINSPLMVALAAAKPVSTEWNAAYSKSHLKVEDSSEDIKLHFDEVFIAEQVPIAPVAGMNSSSPGSADNIPF